MFSRVLLCAVLLAGTFGVAYAQEKPAAPQQQTAAQQKLTPEQQAALEKRNQAMVQYAASIAQMIDNGQAGQAWDQASEVAKQSVSRDKFIQATDADRGKLGKATTRKLAALNMAESKGGKLPAGEYFNVNFATQFAKDAKPVRELVSFHLDSDKKWRLAGYHVYVAGK